VRAVSCAVCVVCSKPAPVAYPFTFPYARPGLSKHRSRSIIAQMGRYVFDLSTPINSDTYPVRVRALRVVSCRVAHYALRVSCVVCRWSCR
jgi:hypothetical protein